jgi:hypothetical protein
VFVDAQGNVMRDDSGATLTSLTRTVNLGSPIGELPQVRRDNFVPSGWVNQQQASVTNLTPVAANMTVHATWIESAWQDFYATVSSLVGTTATVTSMQTLDNDFNVTSFVVTISGTGVIPLTEDIVIPASVTLVVEVGVTIDLNNYAIYSSEAAGGFLLGDGKILITPGNEEYAKDHVLPVAP